jgi:hypothetical protein
VCPVGKSAVTAGTFQQPSDRLIPGGGRLLSAMLDSRVFSRSDSYRKDFRRS